METNVSAQDDNPVVDVLTQCDFEVQATLLPPKCFNSDDGSITLAVSDPVGTVLSYQWLNLSSANNSNVAAELGAGTYAVVVFSADCADTLTFSLASPLPIDAPLLDTAFCGNGGLVNVLEGVSGGTGNYTIDVSTIGDGTPISCVTCESQEFFFNKTTVVLVDIKDENNCMASRVVIVQLYEALEADLAVQDETCFEDGSISVSVTGGSGNYLYSLNGTIFQNVNEFTGLEAEADYEITVLDVAGCQTTLAAAIDTATDFVIPQSIEVTDVSCNGLNDGMINLNINQDATLLNITLDSVNAAPTPNDEPSFLNVSPGPHTVYIAEGSNCLQSYDVMVGEPAALQITVQETSSPTCPGGEDGEVAFSAEGGNDHYSFAVNGVESTTDSLFAGLTAGTHLLMVTDELGCQDSTQFQIEEATEPDVGTVTTPSCPDENTGSIVVVEAGKWLIGPDFEFSLDSMNWQEDPLFEHLAPGDYTIYILFPNGCIYERYGTVEEVQAPDLQLSIQQVACPGDSTGSVTVTVLNGDTDEYLYGLDSSEFITLNKFEDLPAAAYDLFVKDSNQCIFEYAFEIGEPEEPDVDIQIQDATCPDGDDGAIAVQVNSGGTPPFQYSLNNTNLQDENTFQGLSPGDYVVMVRDSNGCFYLYGVNVGAPDPIIPNLTVIDETCSDGNGIIGGAPYGGTAPYQFLWSTGDSSALISNLVSGSYRLTISDANNCGAEEEALVDNLPGPILIGDPSHVHCYGLATGAIDLTVVGGTAPYFYTWSNGEYTQDIDGLEAGSYVVTVMDVHECHSTNAYAVHQPAPLELSTQSGPFNELWAINLEVEGGFPPYSYLWSNGETTEDLFDIPAGVYSVTVTDELACSEVITVEVGLTDIAEESVEQLIRVYPVPAGHAVYFDLDLPDPREVRIDILDVSGRLIRSNVPVQLPQTVCPISDLPGGLYLARILINKVSVFRKIIKQ